MPTAEIPEDQSSESPNEEAKMAADIPEDRAELIFSSLGETNESLTHELAADGANDVALLRRIASRKFHEVNPIEAAAAETVLTLAEA